MVCTLEVDPQPSEGRLCKCYIAADQSVPSGRTFTVAKWTLVDPGELHDGAGANYVRAGRCVQPGLNVRSEEAGALLNF